MARTLPCLTDLDRFGFLDKPPQNWLAFPRITDQCTYYLSLRNSSQRRTLSEDSNLKQLVQELPLRPPQKVQSNWPNTTSHRCSIPDQGGYFRWPLSQKKCQKVALWLALFIECSTRKVVAQQRRYRCLNKKLLYLTSKIDLRSSWTNENFVEKSINPNHRLFEKSLPDTYLGRAAIPSIVSMSTIVEFRLLCFNTSLHTVE